MKYASDTGTDISKDLFLDKVDQFELGDLILRTFNHGKEESPDTWTYNRTGDKWDAYNIIRFSYVAWTLFRDEHEAPSPGFCHDEPLPLLPVG